MSWYNGRELTDVEQSYIELLESVFLVQDEYQKWIPYNMTDYQKEYHAESLNIKMEDAEDLVVIKARGTSFTTSTIIDYIMTGFTFENLLLPIIAQRQDTAKSFVHRAQNIIRHCKSKEIRDNTSFSKNEIYFSNGSSIVPYPSSSAADAVRGERLIRVFIDEFAFQQQDEELLAAAEQTMRGKLGQILIGSTPCGYNNKFAEIIKKNKEQDIKNINIYNIIQWPVFNPKKFNKNILPSKQGLELIAPWISMKKLDKEWLKDRNVFMQENMCFKPDTKIITEGGLKQIQDIKKGDKVFDKEGNLTEVMGILKRKYCGVMNKISIKNGGSVVCTPEHPFFVGHKKRKEVVNKKFIQAKDIAKQDLIKFPRIKHEKNIKYTQGRFIDNEDWLCVKSNIKTTYSGIVYNLETKTHTYLTNIGVVHNCDFLDDSLSYISNKDVIRVNSEENFNYKDYVFNKPKFKYKTQNPVVFGHDYAEKTDYCAIAGFEIVNGKFYKQVFLDYYKGRNIPEQQEYVKSVIECFPTLQKYRIDMTGPGIGLYQNIKQEYNRQIEGIDFRTSIQVGENRKKQKKQNIRKYMVTNLKSYIDSEQVSLIDDGLQTSHLTAMDYSFKIQRGRDGHGDILFADALALLPFEYMNVSNQDAVMSSTFDAKKKKYDETNKNEKDRFRQNVLDHINAMRKRRLKQKGTII